jgi:hypothetical protein
MFTNLQDVTYSMEYVPVWLHAYLATAALHESIPDDSRSASKLYSIMTSKGAYGEWIINKPDGSPIYSSLAEITSACSVWYYACIKGQNDPWKSLMAIQGDHDGASCFPVNQQIWRMSKLSAKKLYTFLLHEKLVKAQPALSGTAGTVSALPTVSSAPRND